MKILNKTLLVTALTITSASVIASNVKVSGFGTLGYSQNDEKNAEVDHVTSKGSWGQSSLLGLQADMKLSNKLSATAKVKLSEASGKMQMTLQTAFLGYQVSDSLKVRVGRLRAPIYMDSEYLDVGYLKMTATTPLAVYGHFRNINGVDAIFTHYTESDLEFQIQPYVGKEQVEVKFTEGGGGGLLEVNYFAGMNASLAGEDWKIRTSYSVMELNNPAYQVDPLTEEIHLNNDMTSFFTIGASYDNGALLVKTEVAQRLTEGAKSYADLTGAYVKVGYKLNDFTPYFMYQTQETGAKSRAIGVNSDFNALSLGARYDFDKVALKAEVTNYNLGKNGAYGYRNAITDNETTTLKSANVLNLTLETVF